MQSLPENTVLDFNVLLPWSYMESQGWTSDSWGNNSIRTFVKLQEGSIDTVVNRKITRVTEAYKENNTIDFTAAPLADIHLHSYFGYGKSPGAILYVYIFSALALFVLLIAWLNFTNLATARSTIRAREVGLRKVTGATRSQLLRQHLFESLVQTTVSVILVSLLVMVLLGNFNRISGKNIAIPDLKPIRAIREQSQQRGGSGLFRKVLVVFQREKVR